MADRISHYRLGAALGKGAMGVVYRAVDERLGRPVALKLLPVEQAGSADMQARMLREAQAASALNHPGIVTVHDIGAFKGQLFIVMELVDGESFSELVRRVRPAPPGKKPSFSGAFKPSAEEAVRLTALAADALGVAHERQILHRDVKSDNLMRTRDGRVKVLDFGLAKRPPDPDAAKGGAPDGSTGWGGGEGLEPPIEDDGWALPAERSNPEALAETLMPSNTPPPSLNSGSSSPWAPSTPGSGVTHVGALVGTPAYMSPEQTRGANADARSEIFSLGVVLYELLTGSRPFDRKDVDATMEAIRTEEPAPPSQANADRGITPAIDAVVVRALGKDRDARYPDMAAFAVALRAAITPVRRSAAIMAQIAKPRRGLMVAAGVALLLAGAAAAFVILRGRGASESPFVVNGSKRLTYQPGCEGYPTFTPDGNTVVYDGLIDGDYELSALDLTTGKVTRLTNRVGWDYGGIVSPDGTRVGFVRLSERGREIGVIPITGEGPEGAQMMGGAMSYGHWAADGGLVYVERGGNIKRWDFPPGGRPVSRSLGVIPPTVDVHDLVAFSDGYVFIGGTESALAASEVFGEVPPGGVWRELERTPLAAHAGMTATPRENAVYYAHSQEETGAAGGELLRRGRDGSLMRLVSPVKPAAGLDIAAQGNRLVYSTCREYAFLGRLRKNERPLELLPRSSEMRDETPMSLDSTHVLFTSNRSGRPQVWSIDLRTGKAAAFAGPGTRDASTSRDGKWVAYAAAEGRGLAIVPATGGAERMLTDNSTDAAPRFSNDGSKVVFQRTNKDGPAIWVVPFEGGKPERISPIGASRPIASPVDDRVLYLLTCAEGFEVQQTSLSGAPPQRVPGLEPASWSEPRFSQDGTRILIVRQKTEVLEAPLDGSSPPVVVWKADQEGVDSVDWAPDGDGFIGAVAVWDGDIWLAEGRFH